MLKEIKAEYHNLNRKEKRRFIVFNISSILMLVLDIMVTVWMVWFITNYGQYIDNPSKAISSILFMYLITILNIAVTYLKLIRKVLLNRKQAACN